jgi:hypothetical protein
VLVAKYFVFVGSMLLTLVFVADWFLPNPPIPFPDRSQIETLTIRIASARTWPEKIVFDTRQPTIIVQAAEVRPIQNLPDEQLVRPATGEIPNMSTPLASIKPKLPARLIVNHRQRLKRKVARRIRSGSPVAARLVRLETRRRCCWSERTNRSGTPNAVSLRRSASSWRTDWF